MESKSFWEWHREEISLRLGSKETEVGVEMVRADENTPLARAWTLAIDTWKESKFRGKPIGKKCRRCFTDWQKAGSVKRSIPPLFSPEFTGVCPVCRGELSSSLAG